MKRGPKPRKVSRESDYDRSNLQAAMAILERPECYGGRGSGPVDWAHRFLERYERERTPLLAEPPTPQTILSRPSHAGKPIAQCPQMPGRKIGGQKSIDRQNTW